MIWLMRFGFFRMWLVALGLLWVGYPVTLRAQKGENADAAERVSPEAERLYQLGMALVLREEGLPDQQGEFVFFKQAAELGHDRAPFILSQYYFLGKGVQRDEKEGLRWLTVAAAYGNEPARMELAMYLYKARLGPEADEKMLHNATLAAEGGISEHNILWAGCTWRAGR